jgi:hypothetical protein
MARVLRVGSLRSHPSAPTIESRPKTLMCIRGLVMGLSLARCFNDAVATSLGPVRLPCLLAEREQGILDAELGMMLTVG